MIQTLSNKELCSYISKQSNHILPDNQPITVKCLEPYVNAAIIRLKHCFSHIRLPYYYQDNQPKFNHLNSDHYSMFLYLLSNTLYRQEGEHPIAEKLFLLNKALHGIDIFYSINLPKIFLFVHPVGTVIGNAKFKNYFVVYQNCTIGADKEGIYPSFGEGALMYSKSSVIGDCTFGDNTIVAANTLVLNQNIQTNSVISGLFPNTAVRDAKWLVKQEIFNQVAGSSK